MHTTSSTKTFEHLYQRERKKSKYLMGTAAFLAVGLVAAVVFGFVLDRRPAGLQGMGPGGLPASGELPEGFTPGAGGLFGGVTQYVNDDGTVDQGALQEFLGNVPEEIRTRVVDGFEQQIETAIGEGSITSEQAADLRAVVESAN